jgi:uncharacterized protein YeeX (DUF496 family)
MEYGSDFTISYKKNNKHNNNNKNINHKELYFLSGRIGIANILKNILHKNERCLIPNYLCDSIYNCFKLYDFDFYNIKNNFDIDYDNIEKKINSNSYKILFIINFFGYIDRNIDKIKILCKSKNIVILEDYTHNIYSNSLYGDISICSYRKSIETPYGCIVVDKNNILNINQKYSINISYIFVVLLKMFSMTLKNIYCLKWLWRRLLNFCEKKIDTIIYDDFDYMNYFLYKYYYRRENKITRKNNIKYLNDKLIYKCDSKFVNTYFTYVILLNNKLERDNLRKYLIDNKIYCPVYWPLNFDTTNCNQYITDRILSIPIDQRYNENDMNFIANCINRYVV